MIQVVIFSFNRAMQLDILLQSIEKFDIHRYFSVSVLYACSSYEYETAYDRLKQKYVSIHWIQEQQYVNPQINCYFDFFYWHNFYWWLKYKCLQKNKSNFKQKIIEILTESNDKFVMFLTDDSQFYSNIEISDLQSSNAFSLRHGAHMSGGKYNSTETGIEWNIYENDDRTDWGYSFSVDGHIYEKVTLLKIIRKIIFNNPNTMESNIACYFTERQLFPQIKANKHSCLVGFELNRVQSVVNNHHLGISIEQLNQYFLDGYRLQIQFNTTQVQYFRPEIESIYVQKKKEQIKIYSR